MAKRRQTIRIRLPRYEGNRLSWRKAIHEELTKASTDINIRKGDPIELKVILYFDTLAVHWHDVDNRLKDIMDALQGRLGGPKSIKPKRPIVPNDNQIYKVDIEKFIAPQQSLGKGHLIIKKYNRRNRNVQPGVVADQLRLQSPYRDKDSAKARAKAGASAPSN